MQRLAQQWPLWFFAGAIMLCAASATRFLLSAGKPAAKRAHATSDVTYVFNLSRTPFVSVGDFKYALLGLGQDPDTGKQIIWVRSITSGRTGGFGEGEALFGGPVKVTEIEPDEIELTYRGDSVAIPVD
jgi:hypothetical protein